MKIKTRFAVVILLVLVFGFGISFFVNQINISASIKKQITEKLRLTVYKYIKEFDTYTDRQVATALTLGKLGGIAGSALRDRQGMQPEHVIGLLLASLAHQNLARGGLFYEKDVVPGYSFFCTLWHEQQWYI